MSPVLSTTTTPCCLAPLTDECVGTLTIEESDICRLYAKKRNFSVISSGISTWMLPTEIMQAIFSHCTIPAFLNMSCTDARNYVLAYAFLQNRKLTHVQLCPNLTILNPFNIDTPINLFKVLWAYHKLEPTVEDEEGLTLLIRPKLSLQQWIEIGKSHDVEVEIAAHWAQTNSVEEGKVEWEMMSNDLVELTRRKTSDDMRRMVKVMGYHDTPHEGAYLHNIIFTQKVFGKCLFCLHEEPENDRFFALKLTFGLTSTDMGHTTMVVGSSEPGRVVVNYDLYYDAGDVGAAGMRKL